jgi:hypothetical protein
LTGFIFGGGSPSLSVVNRNDGLDSQINNINLQLTSIESVETIQNGNDRGKKKYREEEG